MPDNEIKDMVITGRTQDLPTTTTEHVTLETFICALMLTHSEIAPLLGDAVDLPRSSKATSLKLSYQFPIGDWPLHVSAEKCYNGRTLLLTLRRRRFSMGSLVCLETPLPHKETMSLLSDDERMAILKWILDDHRHPKLIKEFGSNIDIRTRGNFTNAQCPELLVDIISPDQSYSFNISDASLHVPTKPHGK